MSGRRRSDLDTAAGVRPERPKTPLDYALLPRNDSGNCQRLLGRHGRDLIYIAENGWAVWDGTRFATQAGEHLARRRAEDTARAALDEEVPAFTAMVERMCAQVQADEEPEPTVEEDDPSLAPSKRIDRLRRAAASFARVALRMGDVTKLVAMLTVAEHWRWHTIDALNQAPRLVNLPNGTFDLTAPDPKAEVEGRTGRLRRHDRADRITRVAGVRHDPAAAAPAWHRFLEDIQPDPAMRGFLQRLAGYCLTAETSEQALFICHGGGLNGKSTFTDLIKTVMGDYAATVKIETFLSTKQRGGGDATPDLAKLAAVRLVLTAEPRIGDRLDESIVKMVTGGEEMAVRRLFRDEFEFRPVFKLILSCNPRPTITGVDKGIWRRIMLIPFSQTFERPDQALKAKLLAERPGILNWMIDGYREWAERGLDPPPAVTDAVAEYRADSDPVGAFLNGWVEDAEGASIGAQDLYDKYVVWAGLAGQEPLGIKAFGRSMINRGTVRRKRDARGQRYLDVKLTSAAIEAVMAHQAAQRPAQGGW